MADVLNRILEKKREEVDLARSRVPERDMRERAREKKEGRSLLKALSTPGSGGANIIAEIKRGSPSRGLMRPGLDAESQAIMYERGGASAISVLTDETFFHGSALDLKAVRRAVLLPVLRKDFIVTPYQVLETAVMGADAILLIVRALSPRLLQELLELSAEVGLDALVEVHTEEEWHEAAAAGARLIGINNRDLATFHTDIGRSVELAGLFGKDHVAVAESGIHGREQMEVLMEAGIFNFLIGESLVKAANPEQHLKTLLAPALKS